MFKLKLNIDNQYFLYSFDKYFGLNTTKLEPINSFLVINKIDNQENYITEDKFYSYQYGFMQYLSIDEEDYLNNEAEINNI